jgi:ribonuclease HI
MKEMVRKTDSDEEKFQKTVDSMREYSGYPVVIFTDGSVEGGTDNGGAGVVIYGAVGVEKVITEPAGRYCSSYEAEMTAIEVALKEIDGRREEGFVIMTDSQAAVISIKNGRTTSLKKKRIQDLIWKIVKAGNKKLVIQWIPGHTGFEGNEAADEEANKARLKNQERVEINAKTIERAIGRMLRKMTIQDERVRKVYKKKIKRGVCSRREEVIAAQVRSGHCPRTRYYQARINQDPPPICELCDEVMEKDHLVECEAWRGRRYRLGLNELTDMCENEIVAKYFRAIRPEWF